MRKAQRRGVNRRQRLAHRRRAIVGEGGQYEHGLQAAQGERVGEELLETAGVEGGGDDAAQTRNESLEKKR